jgi:hypothetical protein
MSQIVDVVVADLRHTLQFKGGHWCIYAWGVYPQGSVLEGQDMKQFISSFDTEKEARSEYPDAELSNALVEPVPSIGPQPANYYAGDGGFYDAGEHWGEDDY